MALGGVSAGAPAGLYVIPPPPVLIVLPMAAVTFIRKEAIMIHVFPKKDGLCVFRILPRLSGVAGASAVLKPRFILMYVLGPTERIHPQSSSSASVNALYCFPSLVRIFKLPGI